MAEEVLDSMEQSERVRKWFEQNASYLILGIATALVLIFGYKKWQEHQVEQRELASKVFEDLSKARDDKDDALTTQLLSSLKTEHGQTVYATMAIFVSAKDLVKAGKLDEAADELTAAVAQAPTPELIALARLRLSQVQAGNTKFEQALQTLQAIDLNAFKGLVAEQRGDTYRAMGKPTEARAAYAEALTQLEVGTGLRNTVQTKLDSLGGAG